MKRAYLITGVRRRASRAASRQEFTQGSALRTLATHEVFGQRWVLKKTISGTFQLRFLTYCALNLLRKHVWHMLTAFFIWHANHLSVTLL